MTPQHRRLLSTGAVWCRVPAYWARSCLLLLALSVAGCGAAATRSPGGTYSTTTPVPSGQGSESDKYVPPVILRNPAPGTLDISLSVQINQQTGDAQSMTEIGLGFLSAGQTVQFAGDERVACNGADLSLKNRTAGFQVLRAPSAQVAGTTLHCDYAAGGAMASVALQIPSAPAITSPPMGAQVVRNAQTLVTYRVDPDTETVVGVVALAPASPSPKALGRLNTPGPLQATVDTSGFTPGPGSLVLTASLTPQIAATGMPFKSVRAFGMAIAPVAVTWI